MRQTIIRRLRMLCCVVATPAVVQGAQFAGQARAPPLPAMDFTLKGSNGSEFRLTQHQGKIALLSFGYTFCPDVCPTTLLAAVIVGTSSPGGGCQARASSVHWRICT
jgi:cytochrome oxidase Cu insertion factor (SCO1/SenC/PrrC family)